LSLLRGNTAEPYDVELTRETAAGPDVVTKTISPRFGYLRISAFPVGFSDKLFVTVNNFLRQGFEALIIDVRNVAGGSFEEGIAAAQLFISSGTLLRRSEQGGEEVLIEVDSGNDAIEIPLLLLTNYGTAHAAELFVASLTGTNRADTVGQRTAGMASLQRLVKLPDGTGLWLSWARYLTATSEPIHNVGLTPDVEVDVPFLELGEPLPVGDPILEQGLDYLRSTIL